jgi:hypothetical protein
MKLLLILVLATSLPLSAMMIEVDPDAESRNRQDQQRMRIERKLEIERNDDYRKRVEIEKISRLNKEIQQIDTRIAILNGGLASIGTGLVAHGIARYISRYSFKPRTFALASSIASLSVPVSLGCLVAAVIHDLRS